MKMYNMYNKSNRFPWGWEPKRFDSILMVQVRFHPGTGYGAVALITLRVIVAQ